jgi:hypothetical protein
MSRVREVIQQKEGRQIEQKQYSSTGVYGEKSSKSAKKKAPKRHNSKKY